MTKDEIKALRGLLKLTQAEFAKKLGVTLITVKFWETGRSSPTGSARTLLEIIKKEL